MSWTLRTAAGILSCVCLLLCARVGEAHFLWVKTISHDNQPSAFLFFGENPDDEAYHLPERMAETKVWLRTGANSTRTHLETQMLETDERIGLIAPIEQAGAVVLEASQPYGVYGQSMLTYHAKHVRADSAEALNASGKSKKLKLDIVPRVKHGQLQLTVLWQGQPLEGADVSLTRGDAEPIEQKTDAEGRVTLPLESKGTVGVLASTLEKGGKGTHDGKDYEGTLHYASLTFEWPLADSSHGETQPSGDAARSALPLLPEPVSSFGAAIADGWLYVYGGHIGEEHAHSAANLSKSFQRIKLNGGTQWEELPMQTPLQGLALVAHDGKLYRVGGLSARNATTDEEEDLHSTDEVAVFDPTTGEWTSLPALPAPRSSHNAAVLDGKLYVVGGWQLTGTSPGEWQEELLVYDFASPDAGWQVASRAPFKRRALAVSVWDGKLAAIGGMNEDAEVSQRVDFYDPRTKEWTEGPDLPGSRMAGFGGAACNLGGTLYASGLQGILYRLNDSGSAWEEAAQTSKPRFFHQLLPAKSNVLVIGGASRKGHMADSEWLRP